MTKQALSVTKTKKIMGRPKSAPTAVVRLPLSVLEAVDKWAAIQDEPLSRPEAIREILAGYLKRKGLL
jgi:hypothetical protein